MKVSLCFLSILSLVALARCAAFTQGNLVVSQFASSANNNGKAINIIEYTTDGTAVQTITLPTTVTQSTPNRCVTSGYTAEGRLSLSSDRLSVGISCMDDAVDQSDPVARPPSSVQRMSFFLDANSAITQKGWGGEFPTFALSSVRTSNRIYSSGHTYVMTADANGLNAYKMVTPDGSQYARTLRIFGNRIYLHDSIKLTLLGSGLDPSDSATTIISGIGSFLHDFCMFDVSTSVKGYDTAFFVDNSGGGKLIKYTYDGTTWSLAGSTVVANVVGLTGQVDGNGDVILYVVTKSFVIKYNGLTQVAAIVSGGQFMGISWAPNALCSDSSKSTSIGESDVDCGGNVCEKCANGKTCTTSLDCLENTCVNNICISPCTDGIYNFGETDLDCGGANCRASYKCAVGKQCATGSDCSSLSCSSGVCVAATCDDGIKNQDESDADCGGATCSVCADNKICTQNSDCLSLQCTSNACAATSCSNGDKDNDETDVDCGGSCNKCALNSACSIDTDCKINNCVGSLCLTPTCSDSKKNSDETDVDCGGSCTQKCAPNKACSVNADCTSLNCVNSVCAAPACNDAIKNGDETDVDCGGSCTQCVPTKSCLANTDCTSLNCVNSKCATPTCADIVKNQDETDVDCGGNTCNKCANTKACSVNTDCTSLHCNNNFCVAAACTDGIKNQGETDVDCGGNNCGKCADNKSCGAHNDCLSLRCVTSKCQIPTCSDSVKNQDETDVDCGGASCTKCANSKRCAIGSDCASLNCKNTVCIAPTCSDTIKNQNETDVDCGGVCSIKCSASKACIVNADCKSNACSNTVCQPTCSDNEKNQDETDVDCGGGSCTKCVAGKTCSAASDCASGSCTNGVCTQTCSDSVKNNGESDVDCGGPLCSACNVGKACDKNGDCASNFCDNSVCATPVVPIAPFQCNCDAPTPFCDKGLESCVGLRVVPIVQCVELTADNEYVAYMAYNNQGATAVTVSGGINFVNVAAVSPPGVFAVGRPDVYPQSAFNIVSNEAVSVTWYVDGYNLTFNLDNQQIVCPEDVTFVMTSSATVEQLIAISSSIVGNLSEIMSIASNRLQVTFSAATKRQATSIINVVVKAGDGPSSAAVVKQFIEKDSDAFTILVAEAGVASVSTVPLTNELLAEAPEAPAAPVAPPRQLVSTASGSTAVAITCVLVVSASLLL